MTHLQPEHRSSAASTDPAVAAGGRRLALLLVAGLVAACGDSTTGPGPDSALDNHNNGNVTGPICGNGEVEAAEECDDGAENSDLAADACRTDCRRARCGDGAVDTGEACDDGVQNSDLVSDTCRRDCRAPTCGDSVIDLGAGETCDDGNTADGDGCRSDCLVAFCGNARADGDEVCDDGNYVPGDGCAPDCRSLEVCGNGVADFAAGETCDCGTDAGALPEGCLAVNGAAGGSCSDACRARFCGNGVTDPGEVCDDGNTLAGDGCSPDCRSLETCGNGVADFGAGEQCDCGTDPAHLPPGCTTVNGDAQGACTAGCRTRFCGNGVLNDGEVCDDGDTLAGDGCSPDCLSLETCGNGRPDFAAGEQCDCGTDPAHLPAGCTAVNGAPQGTCTAGCRTRFCGNGVVNDGEVCDDGNLVAGDGCAPDCRSDESCGNGRPDFAVGEQCDCGLDPDHLPAGCTAVNGADDGECSVACLARYCGNGVRDPGEACDDGNTRPGDGCSPDCRSDETCGNGIVDANLGEQCDDGNDLPGDGCQPSCAFPTCGDGVLDPGEVCDDGNTRDGDGCSARCSSDETCGNGIVDVAAGEQCDDGGVAAGDGCSPLCRLERCGNGVRDASEVCDDGNRLGGDGCSADCRSDETCGNGVVDAITGEQCDDGNPSAGDGCQPGCTRATCGDGFLDPGEVCDDGDNVSGDGCNARCTSDESCGNGVIDPEAGEECDDGNAAAGDGCSPLCRLERCGNGLPDPGEICDDGDNLSGDGCAADCRSDESCGNGIVDAAVGETCDDGNATPGDGCSAGCTVEICGNGVLDEGEVCDDGDTTSGDGCRADCRSTEVCGNGLLDFAAGETCDCGLDPLHLPTGCAAVNGAAASPCTALCQTRFCGNGVVNAGEVCDDGNTDPGDGCSPDCRSDEACGNGVTDVEAGESCDDGNATPGDGCGATCQVEYCGNHVLDPGEFCDDGNRMDGDGCSADCRSNETCGNGIVDVHVGETCDDGSTTPGDGCGATCRIEACGNGTVDPGEVCDDGDQDSGDGCSADCQSNETCGNGYVDVALGETCDDGNLAAGDGCNGQCRIEVCGNGIQDQQEACDDGNRVSGDGCSADCRSNETCGNGYVDGALGEQCDDANLRSHDGCSSGCTLESLDWSEWPGRLARRTFAGMAYDTQRGRLVLFGGLEDDTRDLDDTWEYDGSRWRRMSPAASPPSRSGHALGYHAATGRVVLLGGYRGGQYFGDTWVYDGVTWTEVSPVTSPSPRRRAAATYDSVRSRLVVFGGEGVSGTALGDTWEWDGSTWTQRSVTPAPGARQGAALAFDTTRNVSVLFGGFGTAALAETWEWNGTAWSQRAPTASPPARWAHAQTYAPGPGRVVLFGGTAGSPASWDWASYNALVDHWEYSGTTWVQVTPTAVPTRRFGHALAYHGGRATVVMHGGSDTRSAGAEHSLGDTPEYTGSTWAELVPPTSPQPAPMVWDSHRQRVVLVSGTTATETWEFDGETWEQRSPTASPPVRSGFDLAYDATLHRVVLFGGRVTTGLLADTWVYDGVTWTALAPATSPPARSYHAMAYDAAAQHVLLFGGDDWSALGEYGDTWTLAGNVWSQDLSTPAPAMRRDHRMTYDAARQRVVLLGGWSYVGTSSVYYGDTWEHDGSGWTEAQPTQSPPGRYLHGQAYDPVRQRTVVFSGSGSWYTRTRSDVWEYDGVTWMQVLESSRTGGRTPAYLTYCGRPGNVMMLGTGVAAMLDDVWRYWPTSLHPDEQCGSGADDDGDGLTDCADPDCTGMPCGSGLTCSAGMCQ